MTQALDHRLPGDCFQVAARLTQANAANLYRADAEFPPDQMIEWNSAGDQIAPGFARSHHEFVLAQDSFDGFGLDQGEFELGLRLVERAGLQSVAIAFQANSGNRSHVIDCLHCSLGGYRNVDGIYLTPPHRTCSFLGLSSD